MNFYYLLVICAFCYYVLLLIRDLQILQQNVYNENQRYLKWIVRHKSQVFSFSLFLVFGTQLLNLYFQKSFFYFFFLIYLFCFFLILF